MFTKILESIKTIYKSINKQEDETAYLLKTPANRERLQKALKNVANNKNLVSVDLDRIK